MQVGSCGCMPWFGFLEIHCLPCSKPLLHPWSLPVPLGPELCALYGSMLTLPNKIPQISFMVAFATSLLSILDPTTNSDPNLELGLRLGLGLGLG